MATKIQSTDTTTGITLATGDYVLVADGVDVLVSSGPAVSGAASGTVDILGHLFGTEGLFIGATGSTTNQVTIGQDGIVIGSPGSEAVDIFSASHILTSYGQIICDGSSGYGVNTTGAGTVTNYGSITAGFGIRDAGGAGDTTETFNYGTVNGTAFSFYGSAAATEHVVNVGLMHGDVQLASGAGDYFDSHLGQVFGTISGGNGNDVLAGPTNSAVINGGGGNDALYGGGGDDVLSGGTGLNQLWGGGGSDTASYATESAVVQADLTALYATVGGVVRDTFNSIENLVTGSGADLLVGDANSNKLQGNGGADVLYGRGGSDTFVFAKASDSSTGAGYDTVADFQTGVDRLDLSALHTDPTHISIVTSGGSTSLYADVDGTAGLGANDLAISFIGANAVKLSDIIF